MCLVAGGIAPGGFEIAVARMCVVMGDDDIKGR